MIVMILYMLMGILIGILIKSEIEVKHRRKRLQNRISYLQSTATQHKMEHYDNMLESLRSINKNLASLNKQNK